MRPRLVSKGSVGRKNNEQDTPRGKPTHDGGNDDAEHRQVKSPGKLVLGFAPGARSAEGLGLKGYYEVAYCTSCGGCFQLFCGNAGSQSYQVAFRQALAIALLRALWWQTGVPHFHAGIPEDNYIHFPILARPGGRRRRTILRVGGMHVPVPGEGWIGGIRGRLAIILAGGGCNWAGWLCWLFLFVLGLRLIIDGLPRAAWGNAVRHRVL